MHANTSSSPRVSPWEWAQAALLALNLAWTTVCRGGVRAETMVVTAALTAALLLVHVLERVVPSARSWGASSASAPGTTRATSTHPAGWWLLPFLLYALANVIWITPVRWLGWIDWLRWAQVVAVFWVTLNGVRSRGPRRVVMFALVLLGLVGVVLACYQRFVDPEWMMFGAVPRGVLAGRASGSFGIPNSFAGFLLLLLPAVGALAFRRTASATARVWWGWVAFVLLLGLVLTISRGAWLALVAALTVWPLMAARGTWSRRIRIAAMMLVAIVGVGAALYWKSPKVRVRFNSLVLEGGEVTRPVMWRGAWQLFRDEPLFGTGAGSYNVLFERHRPPGFRDEPLWAHNEYLNTLSDYGAVGFILFFGAGLVIALRCARGARDDPPRRRDWLDSSLVVSGFGVGLLAFALQMALDFHLKIPALGLAAATVAGLAVSRAWPLVAARDKIPLERRSARSIAVGAVVAGIVAAALFFGPRLRAEAWREQARRAIDQLGRFNRDTAAYAAQLPAARAALARAIALDPTNGQAWADCAYATALWSHVAPDRLRELGLEAERFAERAVALSPVCSEFWIRAGVARDMQGLWDEAGNDFSKAVAIAPADAFAWYYFADHLSRRPIGRHAAEGALAFCLRLDPGNPAGLALRQRLAIKSRGL